MKRAIFLTTLLMLQAGSAFPVAAGEPNDDYCRENFPAVETSYSEQDLQVVATFDLDRCARDLAYLRVTIELSREGQIDGDTAKGDKGCVMSRPICRVKITLEHEPIERSHYRAELTYRGHGELQPDGSKKIVRGSHTSEMTCTSAAMTSACLI